MHFANCVKGAGELWAQNSGRMTEAGPEEARAGDEEAKKFDT